MIKTMITPSSVESSVRFVSVPILSAQMFRICYGGLVKLFFPLLNFAFVVGTSEFRKQNAQERHERIIDKKLN